MFQSISIFTLFIVIIHSVYGAHGPLVYFDHDDFKGCIVGIEKLNILNETFNAFLGIQYAKPPIGELRFRDPQKPHKFEGTFYAIYDGYECNSVMAKNASEDCLNLNVYTKKLLSQHLLPVLVVIHPGGFYLGSTQLLEPSYMMTKDIVLVTLNYRLGSMGFLSLGSPEIPGNAGLKDQVYALRWVQKNIAEFGGNPQDVTIMGYSAGAVSVCLHLASPMSRGLFHKAIIMSGAMPPQTQLPQGDQKFLAIRQAKKLNCSTLKGVEEPQWSNGRMTTDYSHVRASDILECLQQFPGQDIAKTLRQMFDFGRDNPIYLWLPVMERDFGQERFLSDDYYKALAKMENMEVPLLIGYTNGEFCTSASDILKDSILKSQFENEFEKFAPRLFMYESQENSETITERLRDFYLNGSKTFTAQDYDLLCDLFSDSLIRFGVHHVADVVAAKGCLVYSYEFRYQGIKAKDQQVPFKKDRVEHMDDLQYLFNWSQRDDLSPDEFKMVELYTAFVYDFVRNGKISVTNARPYPGAYVVIDENGLRNEEDGHFERYKFWLNLLKDEKANSSAYNANTNYTTFN